MSKFSNFVIGAVVGAAVGTVVTYLFGPAHETKFDATYQSRLDKALAEGQLAAQAREAELMLEFEQAKRAQTTQTPAAVPPPASPPPVSPPDGESGAQP